MEPLEQRLALTWAGVPPTSIAVPTSPVAVSLVQNDATGSATIATTEVDYYSFTAGATSQIDYTVPLASLGLGSGDTIYFDAYSSGGGASDSAVDALSNPNVSITSWSQTYTSDSGTGLSSYTITAIPEPATMSLIGLGALSVLGLRRRRR